MEHDFGHYRPVNKLPAENSGLSQHILPTSATMFGICTTFIGLVKVAEARIGPSRVDEYAALASLLFLGSAIASYVCIRNTKRPKFSERYEILADRCFVGGLLGLAAISVLSSPTKSFSPPHIAHLLGQKVRKKISTARREIRVAYASALAHLPRPLLAVAGAISLWRIRLN